MEFINVIALCAVTVLSILGLAKVAEWTFPTTTPSSDYDSEVEEDHAVGELLHHLDRITGRQEDKINALYRHLGIQYREIPAHGEAVTISSLSGLGVIPRGPAVETTSAKQSKERSA